MLKESDKELLQSYAQIKSEIKLLEAKAERLNPLVLDLMKTTDVEEISLGDIGKLSLGARRTWKYSEKTIGMEKELKTIKKTEEQTGLADYSEKHYVIFKAGGEKEY